MNIRYLFVSKRVDNVYFTLSEVKAYKQVTIGFDGNPMGYDATVTVEPCCWETAYGKELFKGMLVAFLYEENVSDKEK